MPTGAGQGRGRGGTPPRTDRALGSAPIYKGRGFCDAGKIDYSVRDE